MFANHISAIKSYNKFLTTKTTTGTGKNQKFSRKRPEENVEAIQIVSSFLKNLIYDPLNFFSEPMGTISSRKM